MGAESRGVKTLRWRRFPTGPVWLAAAGILAVALALWLSQHDALGIKIFILGGAMLFVALQ